MTERPKQTNCPLIMTNPNFYQSFDAQEWAKAFVETVRANPGIALDEGSTTGWFANAIMRGYDEAKRRQATEPLNPKANGGPYRLEFHPSAFSSTYPPIAD